MLVDVFSLVLPTTFIKSGLKGWIKEVDSRAELRGTLVRAIDIAMAYISLWYVHIPRSVLVCSEFCLVRARTSEQT